MKNRITEQAWAYHEATKHSPESVRSSRHFLDWPNKPRPFKFYLGIESLQLRPQLPESGIPAFEALSGLPPDASGEVDVRLRDLEALLYFSAGVTRRRKHAAGDILFRAAACTGALYSIEIYAVCGALEDLAAGVYHFNAAEMRLGLLRRGDFRGYLAEATAGDPGIAHARAVLICTGTYWRNAWKYRARTYRHFGWDNGTILANLLAVAAARRLPASIVNGFVDSAVNSLLSLDEEREVALNLVPVGRQHDRVLPLGRGLPPLRLETVPYSPSETGYPEMTAMHSSSCLESGEQVVEWRRGESDPEPSPEPALTQPLVPLPSERLPEDSIERVIRRRGSSRRFMRLPIGYPELSTILYNSTRGVPADFLTPFGRQLNSLYVVAHAVEGLESGAYYFHRDGAALELLKPGDFRRESGFLGLEQALPSDCAAAVFFLADLPAILQRFGNRGYRAVQLEAGIIGGRLYLAAYALKLGATGLTFYDDAVTRFFSPHASGRSAVFLVALGKTLKV